MVKASSYYRIMESTNVKFKRNYRDELIKQSRDKEAVPFSRKRNQRGTWLGSFLLGF